MSDNKYAKIRKTITGKMRCNMKLAVIGGGSIGLLTSASLIKQGHEVQLVTRTEEQAALINSKGLLLEKEDREEIVPVFACSFENGKYLDNELWINTIKQTQLPLFFEKFKHVKKIPPLLLLQNGMGHMEQAEALLSSSLYAGIVTHGAMRLNEYSVRHTGEGEIYVSGWNTEVDVLTPLINKTSHFPIMRTDNIIDMMKRKLLVNLVVNPLTALYGVRNGELLKDVWEGNLKALFHEGKDVLELGDEEWERVVNVIKQTANNESSMFRDIQLGKYTEIDAITGFVLRQAEEKGIKLPLTSFIHQSILGLEGRDKAE